jgi:hypothetical protein
MGKIKKKLCYSLLKRYQIFSHKKRERRRKRA